MSRAAVVVGRLREQRLGDESGRKVRAEVMMREGQEEQGWRGGVGGDAIQRECTEYHLS